MTSTQIDSTANQSLDAELPDSGEVTRLLAQWNRGDRRAVDRLMTLVYDELHRLASGYMRAERSDHTLQPTALIHEAYFRLVRQDQVQWQNRAQFFGIAAQQMRRILVDHARARRRAKRQGALLTVSLNDLDPSATTRAPDLVALDEALDALSRMDARKGRVIELRIFGGLTIEETASVLDVSNTTVITELRTAKAWLFRRLHSPEG